MALRQWTQVYMLGHPLGDDASRTLAWDRAKLSEYLIHHPSGPSRGLSGAGAPADTVLLVDDGLDQRLMNVRRILHRKCFHRVASEQADGHRRAGGKLDPALRAHDLVHLLVGIGGVTPDAAAENAGLE